MSPRQNILTIPSFGFVPHHYIYIRNISTHVDPPPVTGSVRKQPIQAGILPHMNTNMNMHMNMSTNSKTQKGPPDPPGLPIAEEEIIVNLPALILAYNQDFTRGNHQRA